MNAAHALYQERYHTLENTPRAQALLRCVPRKGRVAWAKLDIPQLLIRKLDSSPSPSSTLPGHPGQPPSRTLPGSQWSQLLQSSHTQIEELLVDAKILVKGGIEAGIFATSCAILLGSLWMIG